MTNPTNRILNGLKFSSEKSELRYKVNRYILIRPETFVRFQKNVEEVLGPATTSEMMLSAVYDIGLRIGKHFKQHPELSRTETVRSMLESASELGWAKLHLREMDEVNMNLILEADNSAFAWAYQQSQFPVCHLIRGIFSGALSEIMGCILESQEVECLAMGFPKCVFKFNIRLN